MLASAIALLASLAAASMGLSLRASRQKRDNLRRVIASLERREGATPKLVSFGVLEAFPMITPDATEHTLHLRATALMSDADACLKDHVVLSALAQHFDVWRLADAGHTVIHQAAQLHEVRIETSASQASDSGATLGICSIHTHDVDYEKVHRALRERLPTGAPILWFGLWANGLRSDALLRYLAQLSKTHTVARLDGTRLAVSWAGPVRAEAP